MHVTVFHTAAERGVRASLAAREEAACASWDAVRSRMRELWTEGADVSAVIAACAGCEQTTVEEATGGVIVRGDPVSAVRQHARGVGFAFLAQPPEAEDPSFEARFGSLAREVREALLPGRVLAFECSNGPAPGGGVADVRGCMVRVLMGAGFALMDEFQTRREMENVTACDYVVVMRSPGADAGVGPKRGKTDWRRSGDRFAVFVKAFSDVADTVLVSEKFAGAAAVAGRKYIAIP